MELVEIGHRKPILPVSEGLQHYLVAHARHQVLPVSYDDLRRFDDLMPLQDADGRDSLWSAVIHRPGEAEELHARLVATYQALIADGRMLDHLAVAGISFCAFGNSQPFRIKILNRLNDNHDYFYVKRADANRVYGLELEHLLSPNRINFLVDGGTLVEEHIIGVPGDVFIAHPERYGSRLNEVRLSKEFVKFNERCFVRLLGDMRAYNFVVDVIHDLDQVQYRIRAIDFDQQSYERRHRIYLPQFFKENLPYVRMAQRAITGSTSQQYRNEERALLRRRYRLAQDRLQALFRPMATDGIAPPEHLHGLASELALVHRDPALARASNMAELLEAHLHHCLEEVTGGA